MRSTPVPRLHVARGWRERVCPTCKVRAGEDCTTPSGRVAAHIHEARLPPGKHEMLRREDVWEELKQRGASIAVVPFWGRAGRGGETERIQLSRVDGDELVDVERWTGRDELTYALEAPVWDRYGTFAGHPPIRGTVIWSVEHRVVEISGKRGGRHFEEIVG
jgi:hypothetical protein